MNILCFGITFAVMAVPAVVSAANTSTGAGAGQDTPVLHVYGPGGPLPAIKEAADAFGKEKHIRIIVTGGPNLTGSMTRSRMLTSFLVVQKR